MKAKTQNNQMPSAKAAPGPRPSVRVYSIFGLLTEQLVAGEFETSAGKHLFRYVPGRAALVRGKLQLSGDFLVGAHRIPNVIATLAATQGGTSAAPPQIASREERMELPPTEYTNAQGFVAALYFHLSGVNSTSLGLRADMSKVQLNVRLFATSEAERELQVIFSDIAASAYSSTPDQAAAGRHVARLNERLKIG